ncbi:hypothetical protein FACS189459_4670 [Bacilli bacterium]|nr:hypothetical protein FACS189459_4670 [Bacilli bacterium]
MTADNFNSSNDGYTNVEPKWICVHDDTPFAITATNNIRDDDTYSAGIPADNLNGTHVNTLSKGLNSNILPSKFFPDFDSTNQQHSIIQFDEYLDICKKYNKQAIIEIKEPNHLVGSPDGDSAKPYH